MWMPEVSVKCITNKALLSLTIYNEPNDNKEIGYSLRITEVTTAKYKNK